MAGRQAIREAFSELLAEGAPEFEGNIRNVLISGDIVLVLVDWRMTGEGAGGEASITRGTATDVMRR